MVIESSDDRNTFFFDLSLVDYKCISKTRLKYFFKEAVERYKRIVFEKIEPVEHKFFSEIMKDAKDAGFEEVIITTSGKIPLESSFFLNYKSFGLTSIAFFVDNSFCEATKKNMLVTSSNIEKQGLSCYSVEVCLSPSNYKMCLETCKFAVNQLNAKTICFSLDFPFVCGSSEKTFLSESVKTQFGLAVDWLRKKGIDIQTKGIQIADLEGGFEEFIESFGVTCSRIYSRSPAFRSYGFTTPLCFGLDCNSCGCKSICIEISCINKSLQERAGLDTVMIDLGNSCNNTLKTFSKVRDELIMMKKGGFSSVVFSGIEPVNSPYFCDLVSFSRELGFKEVSVACGGWHFSDKSFCQAAEKAGLKKVIINVFAGEPETYCRIAGSQSSVSDFERWQMGIENVVNAGFETEFVVNIMKKNFFSLPSISEFLKQFKSKIIFKYVNPIYGVKDDNSLKKEDILRFKELEPYLVKAVSGLESEFTLRDFPFCAVSHISGFSEVIESDLKIKVESNYIEDVFHLRRGLMVPEFFEHIRDIVKKSFFDESPKLSFPFRVDPLKFASFYKYHGKTKSVLCNDCVHYPYCDGIFETHARAGGFAELTCIHSGADGKKQGDKCISNQLERMKKNRKEAVEVLKTNVEFTERICEYQKEKDYLINNPLPKDLVMRRLSGLAKIVVPKIICNARDFLRLYYGSNRRVGIEIKDDRQRMKQLELLLEEVDCAESQQIYLENNFSDLKDFLGYMKKAVLLRERLTSAIHLNIFLLDILTRDVEGNTTAEQRKCVFNAFESLSEEGSKKALDELDSLWFAFESQSKFFFKTKKGFIFSKFPVFHETKSL
ncbi:MAG: hypothetical protein J7K00_00895 [Candidatus Diapherotrites archaeon]|nr:hypothetical protein [Candidatus Diapherotrites archaeon]